MANWKKTSSLLSSVTTRHFKEDSSGSGKYWIVIDSKEEKSKQIPTPIYWGIGTYHIYLYENKLTLRIQACNLHNK
jgi:hypothetical protein